MQKLYISFSYILQKLYINKLYIIYIVKNFGAFGAEIQFFAIYLFIYKFFMYKFSIIYKLFIYNSDFENHTYI